MNDMKIFISYSHQDALLATGLLNLLQTAFGPVLAEVFVDRSSIAYGSNIKDSVVEALRRADLLIAVVMGAQPASALSWPGFEIGRFSAFWEDADYKRGPHSNREKNEVVGQIFTLMNGDVPLGPQQGTRAVKLGIPDAYLSDEKSRIAAGVGNSDLLNFLKDIEKEFKDESAYAAYKKIRSNSLDELARDFKLDAFDVLRERVRSTSKPTKQLIVLNKGGSTSLKKDTKLFSVAGAVDIFGKSETDARLFKSAEVAPGTTRYETSWGEFCAAVKPHKYGMYWCQVIEHAFSKAITGADEFTSNFDSNLVLISSREKRHQVVATTITNFYNNDSEVSLYLIEAQDRPDRGDPETTKLLACLNIVCRFRFAFLERTSSYYWRNFGKSRMNARDLLLELDYLKSEATAANLEKEGAYEEFLDDKVLTEMIGVWNGVDVELRKICSDAAVSRLDSEDSPAITERIVEQLKKIYDELRPYNTLLGIKVAKQLSDVFKKGDSSPQTKPKTGRRL